MAWRAAIRAGVLALGLAVLSGCGDQGASPAATNPDSQPTANPSPANSVADATANSAGTATPASPSALRPDSGGRLWIDGVPLNVYDVFYPDPASVAANTTPVAVASANAPSAGTSGGAAGVTTGSVASPAAAGATAGAPLGGSVDWTQQIATDDLVNEIKRIRNELSPRLLSVGKFNAAFSEVQSLGAALAACAAVVDEYPLDATWKVHAPVLRDLGQTIATSATERGRDAFDACQTSFEQIEAILDGGSPKSTGDHPEKVEFSSVADRQLLMKHMQIASESLRTLMRDKKDFDANKDNIRRQAAVLAMLTQMIRQPDYVFADEADYQRPAAEMLAAALESRDAPAAGNFEQFVDATGRMLKACDQCHLNYRFE